MIEVSPDMGSAAMVWGSAAMSISLILLVTRSKYDHTSRQIFILHFRTSFRTTEVDYRLAAAIAPRAKMTGMTNFM